MSSPRRRRSLVIDGYILYKVSNFDNLENLIIFSITDQSKEFETNMFLCTLNMMCHMNFPDFFLIQVGILRLYDLTFLLMLPFLSLFLYNFVDL